MRIAKLILLVAIAAALFSAAASSAQAACVSSTPSSPAFTDPAGDVAAGGVDLTRIDVVLDAACKLTVSATDSPAPGDGSAALSVFFNSDGDAGTGDPLYDGADFAVDDFGDLPPSLYPCGDFCLFGNGSPLPAAGTSGFVVTLDQLAVASSGTIGVIAETIRDTDEDFFVDTAPDSGSFSFPFQATFSTPPDPGPGDSPPPAPIGTPPAGPPGPPPVLPAPPAPPAPMTVLPIQVQEKKCTVPKLKGKSVSKARKALKKAGCRYKIKGKGRVVSTKPKARTQTSGTVLVKAKKQKKKRKR